MSSTIIIELNEEDAMVLGVAMSETPHLPWGHLADVLALAIMDQKTGPIGPRGIERNDEEIDEILGKFRDRLGIPESR